jgi:hypothetical protein
MVNLSWGKWCIFAKPCHLYSLTSGKLFISGKELEHLWFHSFVKCNKLGLQKAEDLVYVHSNLRLVSRRGEEYTSGPHKDWDVDLES